MNQFKAGATYTTENGQEITLLAKVGDYWMYQYGAYLMEHIPLSQVTLDTEDTLARRGYFEGRYERTECVCGYSQEESFGTTCPSCKESVSFYQLKNLMPKLIQQIDSLLDQEQSK